MALRPTGLCEGGEPITDAPCAKCGATEKDECGALSDQNYEVGLRLAEAQRTIAHLRECLLAVTDELERPYNGLASTVTVIRDARQLLKETQ